mgnify:FL=1
MTTATLDAAQSGTFRLGGDLPVHRLGFGAMRITGNGIWGPPADHAESLAVLRRAIELGVNLIDTAESYGPHVSEELIAEALYPIPKGLIIATKGGLERTGPNQWPVNGRPERLREGVEGSLRRLRVERIDLWQMHRFYRCVVDGERGHAGRAERRRLGVRHAVEEVDGSGFERVLGADHQQASIADEAFEDFGAVS